MKLSWQLRREWEYTLLPPHKIVKSRLQHYFLHYGAIVMKTFKAKNDSFLRQVGAHGLRSPLRLLNAPVPARLVSWYFELIMRPLESYGYSNVVFNNSCSLIILFFLLSRQRLTLSMNSSLSRINLKKLH